MPELSATRGVEESAGPAQVAAAAVTGLTPPEIDALLAGFRDWLMRTVATTSAVVPIPVADDAEPPDLHSLLGQLIALRQEVNLQTRATRSQQEQSAETLRQLSEALAAMEQDREAEAEDDEAEADADAERQRLADMERLRPLLKAMVDAHDALALARREVQRTLGNLAALGAIDGQAEAPAFASSMSETTAAPVAKQTPPLSWLARWLGIGEMVAQSQQDADRLGRQARESEAREREARQRETQAMRNLEQARSDARRLVEAMATGYAMSLQRLERALDQHGLTAIPCVGEPFDPESMEVVEVIRDPGRSASEVVEEVRRGYLWHGRMFRFAQVKVARGG